jgi:hypothetical protein
MSSIRRRAAALVAGGLADDLDGVSVDGATTLAV